MEVERYARDRWEVYGRGFDPFTVRAPDQGQAFQRAIDRMAEVDVREERR